MKLQLTKTRYVGESEKPYIIAELGSNHNGDMKLARKLIDAAKTAGADCVKFQSWSSDTIFSRKTYADNYFLSDDYRGRDDYTLEEIVKEYSISEGQLLEMKKHADSLGIDCISTPFCQREVDFLIEEMGAEFIKVASMDLNNYQFLDYIARKNKPIILSTGLSTLSEIDTAIATVENAGNQQLVILHCVSIYPPKDEQINLKSMDSLAANYSYPVGFSDHSLGTCIALGAIARGACMIEKHFTLDKEMNGWDHAISASPDELAILVNGASRIHEALGNGRIERVEDEGRITAFRRSIVAARDIEEGEVITSAMLDYKRPGSGMNPDEAKYIIGRKTRRKIAFDQMISLDDF